MTGDSFSFGNYNSMDDWGIRVIGYDTLLPQKRSRKISIPGRSGSYDYGANAWEDRTIRIDCMLLRRMTKSEFREIAYLLSKKARLRLWNEPDKYYVAELYDASDVQDYYNEEGRAFELVFAAEPFAYGEVITAPLHEGRNSLTYRGTADTPCVIALKNTSENIIQTVTITVTKRSG